MKAAISSAEYLFGVSNHQLSTRVIKPVSICASISSGMPNSLFPASGAGETFAEDPYYSIAPEAVKRGWNFATVDLPGQGDTPFQGSAFRSDTEVPMKSVLDALLTRPDVDPRRLAAYGISFGGYFVPRAAAFDRRIRACIANSMLFDAYDQRDKSNIRRVKGLYQLLAAWKAPFAMRMGQLMA